VCDGTVGPGATNLVSPLAEAHCSSIPLIAVVSDVARGWEHRRTRGNASQAMDQMEMFKPVSKWQVRVTDPRSLDNIVSAAFRVATTGKPGPVVLCLPDDVASTDIEFQGLVQPDMGAIYPRFRSAPDPAQVARAVERLANAARPVLVVGGGAHISGCYEQVREFAERLALPVVTSISGKGIIAENHPQAFGVTGTFGNPVARDVVKAADVVFFVGCKVGQLTTMTYRCPRRDTAIIHLDIDPEEVGRNYPDSIPLIADAALGMDAMLAATADLKPAAGWDFPELKERYARWYGEMTAPDREPVQPLRPQAIMGVVNRFLTDDDLVVCDASLASGWAAAYLQFGNAGRRCIAPRGLAGLGWGTPAAIGASLANGRKNRILHFAGDGGFGYSLQELEVMKRVELPVLTIVFNNDTLGWIKHVQKDYYDQNYVSTDFSHVDFATVARGFGARGYTARTLRELEACMTAEQQPEGPAVIDLISDQWETAVQGLE
jgi:acetolactate synthase-1/2/3 large subunit